MAVIKCKTCSETNLMKQGNVFVCQSCGAQYSLEEIIAMNAEQMEAKADQVESVIENPVTPGAESAAEEIKADTAETPAEIKADVAETAEEIKADAVETSAEAKADQVETPVEESESSAKLNEEAVSEKQALTKPVATKKCSARKCGCLGKWAVIAGAIFLVCLLADRK